MSRYIFNHPEETYRDEVKCLMKAFERRGTKSFIRWWLLFKTYWKALYRIGRLKLAHITKLPR